MRDARDVRNGLRAYLQVRTQPALAYQIPSSAHQFPLMISISRHVLDPLALSPLSNWENRTFFASRANPPMSLCRLQNRKCPDVRRISPHSCPAFLSIPGMNLLIGSSWTGANYISEMQNQTFASGELDPHSYLAFIIPLTETQDNSRKRVQGVRRRPTAAKQMTLSRRAWSAGVGHVPHTRPVNVHRRR